MYRGHILTNQVSSIDVYLDTVHDVTGSPAVCSTGGNLTVYSYSFVLSMTADNCATGRVEYGQWTDALGFSASALCRKTATDFWAAQASYTQLPAGKYKLGTLALTIDGPVRMTFLAASPSLDPSAITSFGSAFLGRDLDGVMKLGSDFYDYCGTYIICDPPLGATKTTWGKIKTQYLQEK